MWLPCDSVGSLFTFTHKVVYLDALTSVRYESELVALYSKECFLVLHMSKMVLWPRTSHVPNNSDSVVPDSSHMGEPASCSTTSLWPERVSSKLMALASRATLFCQGVLLFLSPLAFGYCFPGLLGCRLDSVHTFSKYYQMDVQASSDASFGHKDLFRCLFEL